MLLALICAAALLVGALAPPLGKPTQQGRGARLAAACERLAQAVVDRALGRLEARRTEELGLLLCAALCAELRAGSPPQAALVAASQRAQIAPRARAAAILGASIPDALAQDAAAARCAALVGIAACWRAAETSGGGLADGIDRVAAVERAGRRVADDLAAETAAPRATARVLAMLPLLGLLLGELLGAHPVAWLATAPYGWLCLALGMGFMAVGHLWSQRILRSALPAPVGQ